MKIVISSGHGKYIRGASGYIDEVDEARRVVAKVAEYLIGKGVKTTTFNDDISITQSANLERIVDFHNSQERDLDISVHFNAYLDTVKPMGSECLYLSQSALAAEVVQKICAASGLTIRGAKKRTDLYFLNNTEEPAILIEVCFVDSRTDVELYNTNFDSICAGIAAAVAGTQPPEPPPVPPDDKLIELLTIEPVTIYQKNHGKYVCFESDLDICNDGSGPSHGDPYHQPQTAYYSGGKGGGKYLNADVDKYIVIPPQVRSKVPPVVMGCKGKLTNLITGVSYDAVTGEIGPDDKTGEAAYCLAKIINPVITHNSGDKKPNYLYELWPGIPAVVDGFTYKLQPAG
jgi:N-acetylmuramoyl-L-alanine amidase